MRAFGLALAFGMNVVVCMLCGFFLGRWLDQVFNMHPLFLIIGILTGIASSFLLLYKMARSD
ncbi:MAG: AtpZ/AtpI family protein [Anaerorhabdus sp.]